MIKWNQITWYSKLGAIILFIAVVPVLTFYIGTQYEKTVIDLNQFGVAIPTGAGNRAVAVSTTSPSPVIITQTDNNKTMILHQGQSVLVDLSGNFVWSNIKVDNLTVLSKQTAKLPAGAQGLYKAVGIGSAVLSATGGPNCSLSQACPMFLLLFKTTVSVVK
jgi:hypothetical protein